MGIVFSAYDPDLDRNVAIKVLRARGGTGASDTEADRRLLREAVRPANATDEHDPTFLRQLGEHASVRVFCVAERLRCVRPSIDWHSRTGCTLLPA